MYPTISAFGLSVTTYGLMIIIGILAILVYYKSREKTFCVNAADVQLALIYGAIGAFLGAKLLYLITVLPQFLSDLGNPSLPLSAVLMAYLTGGFVFYGGFYGALLAAWLYCRHCRINWWKMIVCILPAVPLFHVFGRIGCFLTGCCYGIENETLGLVFTRSEIAPNGVPLLPVQLMEAAVELLLFVILLGMAGRPDAGKRMLALWLTGYGLARFVLEFFRGDAARGFIGVFSTSQIIALVSVLVGVLILCYTKGHQEKTSLEEGPYEQNTVQTAAEIPGNKGKNL